MAQAPAVGIDLGTTVRFSCFWLESLRSGGCVQVRYMLWCRSSASQVFGETVINLGSEPPRRTAVRV